MMKPSKDLDEQIDEILDDCANAWCDDCEHPGCVSKKQAAKQQLLALIEQREREARANGIASGYSEAFKVMAGKYANTSTEDSYIYVADLIKSLDEGDDYQTRLIQSNKTGKKYLVSEAITTEDVEEYAKDAQERIEALKAGK